MDKILRLYALLILIDQRVYPEEIDAIGAQLSILSSYLGEDVLFTPEMGRDWFLANHVHLERLVSTKEANIFVSKTLMNLKNIDPIILRRIIFTLSRIAWADGELHESEQNLAHSAIKLWNLKGLDLKQYELK